MFTDTLLESLTNEQRSRALQAGKLISLRRLEQLPDTHRESWVLLNSGILRVETRAGDGHAIGGFLKKGELTYFAGSWAVKTGSPILLRAVLGADLYLIPGPVMSELIAANAGLAMALIYDGIGRNQKLYQNMGHKTAPTTVEASLGRTLLELSVKGEDGSTLVDRRITQREMAESLGFSREQVNKVLRQLELQGHIEKGAEGYLLNDDYLTSHLAGATAEMEALSQAWRASRRKEEAEVEAERLQSQLGGLPQQ